MVWSYIPQNWTIIWQYTLDNVLLGILPPLIGLVISIPASIACARWRWLYGPTLTAASALYAVPSLALFVILIVYTGLGNLTVIIPLTLFSLCVLVPNVVDGLRGVPEPVRQAATAMGFGELRRLARVDLPLAIPVIIAGLRIATVSSISLASVGQLIGVSSLGYFFIEGEQVGYPTEIYVGFALIVLLALAADLVLVLAGRVATPWLRGRVAAQPISWRVIP